MTEADAKQRWCPFSQFDDTHHRGNRFDAGGLVPHVRDALRFGTRCLGSACMAWRWDSDFNEIMARDPQPADPRGVADGHCGLAGPARQ